MKSIAAYAYSARAGALICLFVFMEKIAFLILITTFAMDAWADMKLAEKNAKEKDYVAKLATSIKAAGSGKYGPIPMPAQAALAGADATKLAKWILAGAK